MFERGKVIVIDDFIEKEYQEQIKSDLLGAKDNHNPQFPWYYIEDVTSAYDPDSKHRPGLAHQYVRLPMALLEDDGQFESGMVGAVVSEYHELFIPCLLYTSPSPRDKSSSRMPSSA